MTSKFKVLASAYACNPDFGSEEGMGWNLVNQLSRFAEVWVITMDRHQEAIERALQKKPLPDVHWIYHNIPHALGWWQKGKRGERFHYNMWQLSIYWSIARKLHKEVQFDATHHLTWGQYWSASYLPLIPVPFVWGPLGGGESAPRSFYPTFGFKGRLYEFARDVSRSIGTLNPYVRVDARRSTTAIAKTEETAAMLRQLKAKNIGILTDALPRSDFEELSQIAFRDSAPFRLVSIGRLLHWKGFYLGIQAFAQFVKDYPNSEYWIIGDGWDAERMKEIANGLGVSDKVKFMGRVPRQSVLEALGDCDVLVHPSLHDSAGWTILEGMAAGKPIVCLDLGGPAMQVTEQTGFKVPAITPEQSVKDMAVALGKLADDKSLRKAMSEAGRLHVKENLLFEHMGDYIANVQPYKSWLANSTD